MNKITYLSKILNDFFSKIAEKIAISTGFIRRKIKLKASSFIKAMIFGNLADANCI